MTIQTVAAVVIDAGRVAKLQSHLGVTWVALVSPDRGTRWYPASRCWHEVGDGRVEAGDYVHVR